LGRITKPRREEEVSQVRKILLQAGYDRADAPLILFGVKLCLTLLLPGLLVVYRLHALRSLPASSISFLFVLLAAVGYYAPTFWVQMKGWKRRQKILEGFPNALDLMVVCVEGGMGLDAAVHRVGEEMQLSNKVLSQEFRLVDLALRAGQSRQTALRSLGLRTNLEDVNNFVTLLIQTDRFGTSIAQALRVYADAMRTTRRQRAEELAAKLPVKLLFPLVFFIFPSLFVVIAGPAGIRIIRALSALAAR
jgi:tight adherence protein C